MNKKAFTLIEILAVIIIIGIIALIGTIAITTTLRNNRNNAYDIQIQNIKNAAGIWAGRNVFLIPDEGCLLVLSDLIQEGLIASDIKDPRDNKEFDKQLCIPITINNDIFNIGQPGKCGTITKYCSNLDG